MENEKTQVQAQAQKNTQQTKKKVQVNEVIYNEFVNLKLLELSSAKLKQDTIIKLSNLEKEVKKGTGKVAKKTVTAAIKNDIVKLIKDYPVPDAITKIIADAGYESYYLK